MHWAWAATEFSRSTIGRPHFTFEGFQAATPVTVKNQGREGIARFAHLPSFLEFPDPPENRFCSVVFKGFDLPQGSLELPIQGRRASP
jgi:hypothetical protein